MNDYLKQYKPFLAFLAKFIGTYLVLIVVYQLFLNHYKSLKKVDAITEMVANNSEKILHFFNFELTTAPDILGTSVVYFVNNKPFVRIVEGCNAVSVMALFVAFIVAFSGRFKTTVLFLIGGVFLIYLLNIIRIALLTMGLFYYQEFKTLLHDIIFPLFIYGVVFLLWILWVNKFSNYAKKPLGS